MNKPLSHTVKFNATTDVNVLQFFKKQCRKFSETYQVLYETSLKKKVN